MTTTFLQMHILQMNIVVSLFAAENDEKRVIRFKKTPADESTSKFEFHNFLTLNEVFSGKRHKALSAHFLTIASIYFIADNDALCFSESTFGDHKNELMAFIHFEELLQKYFENSDRFTVVPKIVFLDVDIHALNAFLMRDRPGEEFIVGFSCFSCPSTISNIFFLKSGTFSQSQEEIKSSAITMDFFIEMWLFSRRKFIKEKLWTESLKIHRQFA